MMKSHKLYAANGCYNFIISQSATRRYHVGTWWVMDDARGLSYAARQRCHRPDDRTTVLTGCVVQAIQDMIVVF